MTHTVSGKKFAIRRLQLTGGTSGDRQPISLTSLDSSGFVATWVSFGSGVSGTFAQVHDLNGNPLGSPFAISVGGSVESGVATRDGRLLVTSVAELPYPEGSEVRADLYGMDGARLAASTLVSTGDVGSQSPASTAALAGGAISTSIRASPP